MKRISYVYVVLFSVFIMGCSFAKPDCPHGHDHEVMPNCVHA